MTQSKVVRWYRMVGGRADALRAAKRVAEEAAELIAALEAGDVQAATMEAADVGLCLLVTAEIMGCNLDTQMDAKHAINLHRKWTVDPDGALYHEKGRP